MEEMFVKMWIVVFPSESGMLWFCTSIDAVVKEAVINSVESYDEHLAAKAKAACTRNENRPSQAFRSRSY